MNTTLPDLVLIPARRRARPGEWRRAWKAIGPLYPIGAAVGVLIGNALAIIATGG